MPYARDDLEFHQYLEVLGRVSKWGSRVIGDPPRCEFDLLTPSQEYSGTGRKMLCVRICIFDPQGSIGKLDYCKIRGLPKIKNNRLEIMAFSKDVQVINRWIPKAEVGKEHG